MVCDPINVRYATDSTNMQVWCLHNPVRYAFVATDGPVVVFDFHGSAHLSAHLELVDEVRPGRGWYFFNSGERVAEHARLWAAEIAELVRAHGGGNRRLALDKADQAGVAALAAEGLVLHDGQEVMELARAIKAPTRSRRCAARSRPARRRCGRCRPALRPGISEQALWAELHAGNIARGGEWIETRLLASGPRTNPWFQECSSRVIEAGDLVAFDTDLIGPYGYCADISRTWLCGEARERGAARALPAGARADRLQPGPDPPRPRLSRAVGEGFPAARALPRQPLLGDRPRRRPVRRVPGDLLPRGRRGRPATTVCSRSDMTICLESYVGAEGGAEGVKLEQQVLVTADGAEVLSTYPFADEVFG